MSYIINNGKATIAFEVIKNPPKEESKKEEVKK